ncbi:MAG: hypothetical protein JW910_07435 [Anaerolineae bacterium]|nr:hypothetical protein [Anaerolineae bacterium]
MAWIGPVMAAKKAEEERQLEEEMLGYQEDEVSQDWEFKIVRSATGAFSSRRTFERLVTEESEAGWELLEKLDDKRVRFKRHTSARLKDYLLPEEVDPYRTAYGMSEGVMVLVIIGVILTSVFVVLSLFAAAGLLH